MAEPFVIFQGNLSPVASYTFTVGGQPYALTGCTVAFSMRPIGGTVAIISGSAATIIDAINGKVEYDWLTGDTAIPGTYAGWFTVTLPNGKKQDSSEFEIEVAQHATAGAAALVSIEEMIDHLRLGNMIREVSENDHQTLRGLILAASQMCEQVTSHRFAPEIGATHTFAYLGDVLLNMTPYDLRTVTAISIDTDTAPLLLDPTSQYRLEPRNSPYGIYTHLDLMPYQGTPVSGLNWWGGGAPIVGGVAQFGREVQVTGNWGWATVPETIKLGVKTLAARWFQNPLGAQIVRTQNSEVQFSRGSAPTAKAGDDIPDEVAAMWRPFVRTAVG